MKLHQPKEKNIDASVSINQAFVDFRRFFTCFLTPPASSEHNLTDSGRVSPNFHHASADCRYIFSSLILSMASSGRVSANSGDVSAKSGDVSAKSGDVSAKSGDVSAKSGDVSAKRKNETVPYKRVLYKYVLT